MLKRRLRHSYYRFRAWLGRPWLVEQVRPIVLSQEERCQDPIFIVGVHRSGTSLMRRVLNSHSRIACPPETYFLAHFAAMVRDDHTYAGFRGLGFDEGQARVELSAWASRQHEAYRLAHGKARWADKTPQYVAMLPELDQLFGPCCKYLMVFRHPLDVLYSQWARGWRFGDHHPDLLLNNAYYLVESLNRMMAFRNAHSGRCYTVYYERLVSEPERELKDLFAFLGEHWEEGVLRYNEKSHGFGLEDPIVRGTRGFVKNFGYWRALSEEQAAQVVTVLRQTMESLGYTTESDLPCV